MRVIAMRITKNLLWCAAFLMGGYAASGQYNLLVSQYMYNGLTLNPAYAGSQHKYSVAFMYRNQWTAVEGAPDYRLITMHTPLFGNRVGTGIFFNQEKIGVHSSQNMYLQLAYKVRLKEGFLSMGLSGGGSLRRSDYTQLLLLREEDPLFATRLNYFAPNFGVGFYYYDRKMYVGLSAPYMMPAYNVRLPSGGTARLRGGSPVYLTAGTVIGQGKAVQYYPSLLYTVRGPQDLDIGTLDLNNNVIFLERFMTGLSYRFNTSVVLLSYFMLTDKLRVTYSYDVFLARGLAANVAGTHEIMINYRVAFFPVRYRCSAYF